MYYEEKLIDGVLHYRMTPNGRFTPMSAKKLTTALFEARKEIKKANIELDKIIEKFN